MEAKLLQAIGDSVITLTAVELKDIVSSCVKEVLQEHHQECIAFTEEERSLLRDLISGARSLKQAVIWAIIVAILISIGVKYLPQFK